MPLDFSHSKVDPVTLVTLKGTIVAGNDTELLTRRTQELLEAGETRIIVDLGQVKFIDSMGIGALMSISKAAMRISGSVKLLHLTKQIHDVLQITRLSSVFGIYDDLQKAIASFVSQP